MSTMSVKPDPGYLAMPDAVNVNLLPVGYPAYLGYTDGAYATENALRSMFPEAELVLLTVMAGTLQAHGARVAINPGADAEPGDLTAAAAANWAARAIAAGTWRPVIYASVKGTAGYGMPWVIGELAANRVARPQVRLLSAHYGAGAHICGPRSCGLTPIEMDGTQWTDSFAVPGGVVDMSLLKPDFFQTPPVSTDPVLPLTGRLMQELGTVRQGDTGAMVRTVQGLCNARIGGPQIKIDGVFGSVTAGAVKAVQMAGHVTEDGVVGPLTWPVLLGVA